MSCGVSREVGTLVTRRMARRVSPGCAEPLCKLWHDPGCKEFDPFGDTAQGLRADERVSESDHRLGLASRHRTAEHGFTTRAVVREEVTEDLRDGEPTWMGKMT